MELKKLKSHINNFYPLLFSLAFVYFLYQIIQIRSFLNDSSMMLTRSQPTVANINEFNKIILEQDLINKISSNNLEYLGICITILIFVAGFSYFFSIKPLQDEMKKNEEDLSLMKNETEKNIKNIKGDIEIFNKEKTTEFKKITGRLKGEVNDFKKESLDKIEKLDKKYNETINDAKAELKTLRDQVRSTELDHLWSQYWIWSGQKIDQNSLSALLGYMTKAVMYKDTSLNELSLRCTLECLERIKERSDIYGKKLYESLLIIIEKVEGDENVKDNIKKEIKRILLLDSK